MDYKTQVMFVDAHAQRIGRTHYLIPIRHQLLFDILPYSIFSAGMIIFG